ncbi:MAG: T9SS type A sorting domain-containing protein [Bacteroidetes bacterium]|nr:T9SS type A sorting domain-containing protein [Bacteroidota bacterium]
MKTLIFLILFAHSINTYSQSITEVFLPNPDNFECFDAKPKLNQLIYGADPTTEDNSTKPILIFVHGWFDNGFGWFFMGNSMYEKAYSNGYRTAFTNQSQTNSFEKNGQIIADMVRKVSNHYGQSKDIIIVAHSKGGLDVDYAMIKYGVDSLVKGVVALSVPYYGVPLTDWTSSFLEPILNKIPIFGAYLKDRGTRQMQTANMIHRVRPMIDNNPNNHPEKYYTFGGWGYYKSTNLPLVVPANLLSLISYSQPPCIELPVGKVYGEAISLLFSVSGALTGISKLPNSVQIPNGRKYINDGLATYASTLRPGSLNVGGKIGDASAYLNHFDFLWGNTMWKQIHPILIDIQNNNFERSTTNRAAIPTISNEFLIDQTLLSSQLNYKKFSVDELGNANISLFGFKQNQKLSIVDNQNNIIYETAFSDNNGFGNLLDIQLTNLATNKTYSIQSDDEFFGNVSENTADLKLITNLENLALKENNILELKVENNEKSIYKIKAVIEKTLDDENDIQTNFKKEILFISNDNNLYFTDKVINLSNGIYNLSVIAESNSCNKFFTTSFFVESKKNNSAPINVELNVFPNPTNGTFQILLPGGINEKVNIKIFDITGIQVFEETKFPKGAYLFLNTQLPIGVYIVKVENQSFNGISKLIISK